MSTFHTSEYSNNAVTFKIEGETYYASQGVTRARYKAYAPDGSVALTRTCLMPNRGNALRTLQLKLEKMALEAPYAQVAEPTALAAVVEPAQATAPAVEASSEKPVINWELVNVVKDLAHVAGIMAYYTRPLKDEAPAEIYTALIAAGKDSEAALIKSGQTTVIKMEDIGKPKPVAPGITDTELLAVAVALRDALAPLRSYIEGYNRETHWPKLVEADRIVAKYEAPMADIALLAKRHTARPCKSSQRNT